VDWFTAGAPGFVLVVAMVGLPRFFLIVRSDHLWVCRQAALHDRRPSLVGRCFACAQRQSFSPYPLPCQRLPKWWQALRQQKTI